MSLTKGFLKNTTNGAFSKRWILTGILLGLNIGLIIYAFSVQMREAFRFLTHFFRDHLLILSSTERTFYNLFYAVIGSIIGCSFALKFIFDNSRNRIDSKVRLAQTIVINNHNFTTWHTMNWMAKVFLITGFWYITSIMQYDINFYDEFYWFFILLPLVWFLNLWLGMHRLLGRKAYRWMGIAAMIITVSSFLFTKLDIVDSDIIDKKLLKSTIEYNYEVNTPNSLSYSSLPYYLKSLDLHVGFNKNGDRQTVLIIGDYGRGHLEEFNLDEVKIYLLRKMDMLDEHARYKASVRLFIDKQVDMHTVYLLTQEIARAGIYNILFQTDPTNSAYPAHYPPYFNYGIMAKFPFNCDCEIDVIDSLRQLGYKSNQIRFPESYCYRMAHINSFNRLKITIKGNGELVLNRTPISYNALKQILFKFENKYFMNSLVILDADGRSSYNRYIEILDLIRSSIISKRNKLSMGNYNLPYTRSDALWDDKKKKMEIIEKLAPMNILEMTYTDRYFYNFVRGHP